jgi:hypothetical protein
VVQECNFFDTKKHSGTTAIMPIKKHKGYAPIQKSAVLPTKAFFAPVHFYAYT